MAPKINLVVGDMFKVSSFASSTRRALRLVKWFNSHSLALGMLREVAMQKLNEELNLILPCLTRWTSHYLSVRRLLQLERAFKQLVLDKEEELRSSAGQRRDAIDEARRIISMIKTESFWDNLRM
ncbi:hypothetical protein AURDEDRAFT_140578 [Auricularia subglabra TFB-10046 SS5]|nr:hypothetical protein AURDEDRAFT_140578 [Auricularia subglabra TFB-10046 SS5]